MNLHDIHQSMPHIDIIAAYLCAYYSFEFVVRPDRNSVEYSSNHGQSWSVMTERDTMSYTNSALEWAENGRTLD